QILADLQTIAQHTGGLALGEAALAGRSLAYLGDGANNMAHSYLLGGATAGMHVRIASPATHRPDPGIVADAAAIAERTGGSVMLTEDPRAAVTGDRKSTRLNSSHVSTSYAVFRLKKTSA